MRPASHFVVKMWPAYETEFETPDLYVCLKFHTVLYFGICLHIFSVSTKELYCAYVQKNEIKKQDLTRKKKLLKIKKSEGLNITFREEVK